MYHYVRPAPHDLPFFRYLHVEDFARQLDWFDRHLGFVRREEFEDACATGRVPDGVLLTFDDGLADHYDHVFPLLQQRGLFGFFYVCTSPYDTDRLLDVHRIHLLLGRLGGQLALRRLSTRLTDDMLSDDAQVQEFRQATYSHQDNDRATTLFKQTLNYLISYQFRQAVLDDLFNEEFGNEGEAARSFYLTPDQIRAMDAAGMIMGSHGVNHYVFSKLTVDQQRDEIARSFAQLSRILGKPVTTFCYPYGGRHTFTEDTVGLLKKAGATYSFDVDPRDVTSEDLTNGLQVLPRYDCNMFPFGRASTGTGRARQSEASGASTGADAVGLAR
jgi:peptidoglycan/xylan/chitin deacetylase (PgdA/CDA1 family)